MHLQPAADAVSRLALSALQGAEPAAVEAEADRLRHELPPDDPGRGLLDEVVVAVRARHGAEAALRDGQARLAEAQRIGHMGSYDWEIDTDTNTWSDELYRIYGEEPQSFNASYERFLDFVHPDDRASIIEIHQRALETCAPFRMEERIVRRDGEERLLESWGEVVVDREGRPVRLRGICRDVTEQRRAEADALVAAERLASVVEAAPDALVVVNGDGIIVETNQQVESVLGYTEEELLGRPVETLLPEGLHDRHRADRLGFMAEPHRRSMGVGLELAARRKDGTEIAVDVALGPLSTADGLLVAAFVRDVSERRRAEALALRLHEIETRRRQALELNDNIVQGIVAASYAIELGEWDRAAANVRATLEAARSIMEGLLDDAGDPTPGSLVRASPAPSHAGGRPAPGPSGAPSPPAIGASGAPAAQTNGAGGGGPVRVRVLIVDDAPDIRLLVRRSLESIPGIEVVGEAADGGDAVAAAGRLNPDVVLLDLAMPGMDGLEALPLIKAAAPGCDVIALSGFAAVQLQAAALDAGAAGYVEKGTTMTELVECMRAIRPDLPDGPSHPGEPGDGLGTSDASSDDALAHLVHELRTPLTVVTGVAHTLADRRDQLPSSAVQELLETIGRNGDHMAALLDTVADAHDALEGHLLLAAEHVDLTELCRTVLADLAPVLAEHPVMLTAQPGRVVVPVDPVRVRQVLTNLLTNVARFTAPGTRVDVSVAVVGDAAELSVRDWGPGIPADRAPELFRQYSRLGATSSGMGLGLYLSRALARAHGGDLVHDRSVTRGSRFVLRLPGAEATAAS